MSILRPAERLAWHRGAALLDRDLTDWASYEPELLALHVRAAHGTWGVASGLDVVRTADLRSVVVSPGIAYTCNGRIIGLESAVSLPAPIGGAAVHELVISAAESTQRKCGGKAPPCPDSTPIAPSRLQWQSRDHVDHCRCHLCGPQPDRVTLARVASLIGGTLGQVSYDPRPVARPQTRPAIGRGSVAAADLTWHDGGLSIWATIDTRDAQFTSTPLYFAALHALPALGTRLIGPWLQVGGASRTVFNLTLRFAAKPAMSFAALSKLVRPKVGQSTIVWFGVEPHLGCGGSFNLAAIIPHLPFSPGGGG
jgi:hypothetical protein